MPIKPLYDRVIVRVDKPKERTAGGIIVPQTAKQDSDRGEVIAVGDGHRVDGKALDLATIAASIQENGTLMQLMDALKSHLAKPLDGVALTTQPMPLTLPMIVSIGDRVCFPKYAGLKIEVDGEELLILREEEISGILEEEVANDQSAT